MKKILFLFFCALLLSCSNNNDQSNTITESTSLNLVTGINCRQNFDDVTLKLGNPNTLVNNKFILYPNPANSQFSIVSQENMTNIWIVSANAEKIHQEVNFISLLNSNLYSEPSIVSSSNISLNELTTSNIGINIETLPKGYYKIFVKIGGQIYWDNLYKYENNGNNSEQFTLLNNFWN